MFRSTDFMRTGHTDKLTSGFSQTWKGWGKCYFFKSSGKYRENQGNFSESKNRENQSMYLLFLFYILCFIYVLYIMFNFLFYLMRNKEEKIRHCSIR